MSEREGNATHALLADGSAEAWEYGALHWVTLPLLIFAALLLVGTAVLFALGVAIGPWHAPVALGMTMALVVWVGGSRTGYGHALARSMILPAVVGACGLVANSVYDFSGDGQQYHQPAVFLLAEGWNPFRYAHIEEWRPEQLDRVTSELYVDHYAKGAWLLAAAIYAASGEVEAAKLFNLAFPVACFFAASAFLARLGGVPRTLRLVTSALLSANPVVVYQASSYFVDGQLAALTATVIVGAVAYWRFGDRVWLLVMSLAGIALINVKFTGVVYFAVIAVLLGGVLWVSGRRDLRRYGLTIVATMAVGVGLVGYQPYVTNLADHGNPFFPAMGHPRGGSVVVGHAPEHFLDRSRLEKSVRSLFSPSGNRYEGWLPGPKVPFTVKKEEMYIFSTTNVGLGGFGPWFSGALTVAMVLTLVVARKGWSDGKRAGLMISLLALGSAASNPEMWWARLAPQVWLLPFGVLVPLGLEQGRLARAGAWVLAGVLAVNVAGLAAYNWGTSWQRSSDFRAALRELRERGAQERLEVIFPPEFELAYRRRFVEAGVLFSAVEAGQGACRGEARELGYPRENPVRYCLGG